jgi:hypothetical protein
MMYYVTVDYLQGNVKVTDFGLGKGGVGKGGLVATHCGSPAYGECAARPLLLHVVCQPARAYHCSAPSMNLAYAVRY